MHQIKVLGVEGYHLTEILLQHVEHAVEELGIECRIEKVSDVNALIEAGINAIPALIINDHLIFQRIVPHADALKLLLKCLLSPIQQPEDFQLSVMSKNALTSDQKSKIHRNIKRCIPAAKLDGFITARNEMHPNKPFLYLPGEEFPPSVNNLLYPLEYSIEYNNTLSKAFGVANNNDATLHLANIKENPQGSYLFQQLPFQRKTKVAHEAPVKFQLTEIQSPDYITGLHNYSNEQAIDLLMLTNGPKNNSTSHTGNVIDTITAVLNVSTIPLMFL